MSIRVVFCSDNGCGGGGGDIVDCTLEPVATTVVMPTQKKITKISVTERPLHLFLEGMFDALILKRL